MQRVVAYLRVSTDRQERDGVSLETQLAMAERYCADRGWAFVGSYTDVMSGRNDRRPELKRLEQDARAKAFDVVICYKIDRLARNAKSFYRLLTVLHDSGISLASLTQDIDTSTPAGKLTLGMLALIAEMESDNTSERVAGTMRTIAAKGRWVSGPRAPYGYKYVKRQASASGEVTGGCLVVVPDEAAVVQRIFDLFLEHRSLRGVCSALNGEGIRTRTGTIYTKAGISYVLRNPAYTGTLAYGRYKEPKGTSRRRRHLTPQESWVVVEGTHEAIITQDQWDAAQRILDAQKATSSRLKYAQTLHPWSGLFRCVGQRPTGEVCGKALSIRKKLAKNYSSKEYICRGYVDGGVGACKGYGRVPLDFLERDIIRCLSDLLSSAGADQAAATRPKRQPKAPPDRTRQIAALEAKREREKELFRGGYSTFDEMAANIRSIDDQLKALASTQPTKAQALPVLPTRLVDLWPTLKPVAQAELLRMLIAYIEVGHKRMRLVLKPYEGWPEDISLAIPHLRWHGKRRQDPSESRS